MKSKSADMNVLNKTKELSSIGRIVDYDLHGVVGVRLIDPTARDAAVVAQQLGQSPTLLNREPDILLYFKDKLPTPHLRYAGLDTTGFAEDGFYVLRSSKAKAKVRIPFEKIGGRCEIFCESGLRSVPLLLATVNLTLTKKNYVPLHASAFVHNGTGILVTGWAKGGKTEALLAFASHGARYVGDEWVILSSDGKEMFGIPEPIRLWDWHLESIPRLWSMVGPHKKIFFKSVRILDGINERSVKSRYKTLIPFRILREVMPPLKRQLNVRMEPEQIFEKSLCSHSTFEKVFLLMNHNKEEVQIERCDPLEIATRMIHSNAFEFSPFFENYQAFKFAFPHLRNEYAENVFGLQKSLLSKAFEGKEAYLLLHPYPVSLEALFQKMEPFCR